MTTVSRRFAALGLSAALLLGSASAGGAAAPVTQAAPVPVTQTAPVTPAALAALPASELLRRAIEANGGQALRELRTGVTRAVLVVLGEDGEPALAIPSTTTLDFARDRLRLEYYDAEGALDSVQVLGEQGAFAYTPQSGTVPLPRGEARTLRDALGTGIAALLRGERAGWQVRNLGHQEWAPLDEERMLAGTVLELSNGEFRNRFLLNGAGEVIAERSEVPDIGDTITYYHEVRVNAGVREPVIAVLLLPNGVPIMVVQIVESELNIELPEDAFALPED